MACESPERVTAMRGALRPAGDEGAADRRAKGDLDADRDFTPRWPTAILFDARAPQDATRPGGLGQPFDWTLLTGIDPGIPFMLSGGLDADNVIEALRITRAPGVDVSSGVERAPGEKDPDKIRAFIRAARAADARASRRQGLSSA